MKSKLWKVFLKEGDVKSFTVLHTVDELSRIKPNQGCVLTTPTGNVVFVNESNIACIVELPD